LIGSGAGFSGRRLGSWIDFLQQSAEIFEAVAPEGFVMLEPGDQRLQPFRPGAIEDLAPLRPLGHEARGFERLQMLRNGSLSDAAALGQVDDADLARPRNALENRPPRGIGERAHDGIDRGRDRCKHGDILATAIALVKANLKARALLHPSMTKVYF